MIFFVWKYSAFKARHSLGQVWPDGQNNLRKFWPFSTMKTCPIALPFMPNYFQILNKDSKIAEDFYFFANVAWFSLNLVTLSLLSHAFFSLGLLFLESPPPIHNSFLSPLWHSCTTGWMGLGMDWGVCFLHSPFPASIVWVFIFSYTSWLTTSLFHKQI